MPEWGTRPANQYLPRRVTAVAGGGLPDVMRMDIIWTPEFAALGALTEVDGMPGFDQIKTSVFAGPLATNAYKGKYYGVPLDTDKEDKA